MAARYRARFTTINHRGMVWLQNVPNFDWVYLHLGNSHDDTQGCILVGRDVYDYKLGHSRIAYERIYNTIVDGIESDEGATLEITDELEAYQE